MILTFLFTLTAAFDFQESSFYLYSNHSLGFSFSLLETGLFLQSNFSNSLPNGTITSLTQAPANHGPLSHLAYFDKHVSSENLTNALGFIATDFLSLEEIHENGTTLQTFDFRNLSWAFSRIVVEEPLHYATLTGHLVSSANNNNDNRNDNNNRNNNAKNAVSESDFRVSLTVIATTVSGNLSTGAYLTPQTVEQLIDINNFPYLYKYSRVRLNLSLAAAYEQNRVVEHVESDFHRIVMGQGDRAIYFDLSQFATCDSLERQVNITEHVLNSRSDFLADVIDIAHDLNDQGKVLTLKLISVLFPEGAINITYDPSIGAGPGPSVMPPPLEASIVDGMLSATILGIGAACALALSYCQHRRYQARKKKEAQARLLPQAEFEKKDQHESDAFSAKFTKNSDFECTYQSL